jgi:hypothetical protein
MKHIQTLIVLLLAPSVFAQQLATKPQNCESDIAILDAASSRAGEDGLIILIARLGDGERNKEVNHRRLFNARTYLTEWDGRRNPKNIVTAEGEPVVGYGRIELYVGGAMFHVLLIHRNADLIVGSCTYEINSPSEKERENNLYPWRDVHKVKAKKQRLR